MQIKSFSISLEIELSPSTPIDLIPSLFENFTTPPGPHPTSINDLKLINSISFLKAPSSTHVLLECPDN